MNLCRNKFYFYNLLDFELQEGMGITVLRAPQNAKDPHAVKGLIVGRCLGMCLESWLKSWLLYWTHILFNARAWRSGEVLPTCAKKSWVRRPLCIALGKDKACLVQYFTRPHLVWELLALGLSFSYPAVELSLSVQVWTSKTTYCKPGTRVMFIISDMCYYSPRDLFLCFRKKRVRYMASFQISGCKYLRCFAPCHGRINTK